MTVGISITVTVTASCGPDNVTFVSNVSPFWNLGAFLSLDFVYIFSVCGLKDRKKEKVSKIIQDCTKNRTGYWKLIKVKSIEKSGAIRS